MYVIILSILLLSVCFVSLRIFLIFWNKVRVLASLTSSTVSDTYKLYDKPAIMEDAGNLVVGPPNKNSPLHKEAVIYERYAMSILPPRSWYAGLDCSDCK